MEEKKDFITWTAIDHLVGKFYDECRDQNYMPDVIVAIGKGGLIPGTIIANCLNKPLYNYGMKSYNDTEQGKINVYQPVMPAIWMSKRILIVDDINDTGKSFEYVSKVASIWRTTDEWEPIKFWSLFRRSTSKFDAPAGETLKDDNWIVMPWEY